MFIVRWLSSKHYRHATELRRQIRKYLNHQRDILQPEAIQNIEGAISDLDQLLTKPATAKELKDGMEAAEKVANQNLKPYANANIRENIDVVLVAIAVALAVRTFFLQPFKIPTGSMQPTLFGITHSQTDLRGDASVQFPGGLKSVIDSCFYGISYYHVVAKSEGEIEELEAPKTVFPFVKKQRLKVGAEWYTIWFPPDQLEMRANLRPGQHFKPGDDIIKTWVKTGDHLFVDRVTYNFRPPKRGEIIVFETKGIDGLPPDQFYIKRLVGLGGEKLSLGDDQHLVVNGQRLDASTSHFENVYTFDKEPQPNHYFGHVNGTVNRRLAMHMRLGDLAPLYSDKNSQYEIPPKQYVVMGDNTLNSFDSRAWGAFPREKVIGKSCFVYWPISERFGWSHR